MYPGIDYRPGSMGKPTPGIDLEVVDDDGNVLERGVEGNLAVKIKPERPVGLFTKYLVCMFFIFLSTIFILIEYDFAFEVRYLLKN